MPRSATHILGRLGMAALVVSIATLSSTAQAQNTAGPKVGFVNLNKILENWDVVKNFENEINARIEATQDEIKRLGEEVNTITDQIEEALLVYPPTSEQVVKLKEERRKKLAQLKSTRDFNLVYLQRQVNSSTLEFYNRAVAQIQDYGRKNGYDVILKISDEKLDAEDTGTLKLKISYRAVVYAADQNDITEAVLAELNKS